MLFVITGAANHLAMLAATMSVSAGVDLLSPLRFSKRCDLCRGVPFRCLNLVTRPNLGTELLLLSLLLGRTCTNQK